MDIFFILYVVYWGLAILTALFVLTDNKRPPEVNLLWLFILLFIPFVGLIIYIVFGVNLKRQTIFKILAEDLLKQRYRGRLEAQKRWLSTISQMSAVDLAEKLNAGSDSPGMLTHAVFDIAKDSDCRKTVRMMLDTCGAPLAVNESMRLFFTGTEAFESLTADLKAARRSVDMEFYIWRSDRTGEEILSILEERAKAGVRIRLIFDSIGCWGKISFSYRRKLKAAGISFRWFLDPLSYFGHRQINFRTHRKAVIIDEKICYTGGMNIGDEYRFPNEKKWYKSWRDTFVRLEGNSAAYMQDIFEIDWHNSNKGEIKRGNFSSVDEYPEDESVDSVFAALSGVSKDASLAQIVCSGPDSSVDSIELLYGSLIANANKYVYIQSPYFIPSDNVLKTLQTAALSGIEIKIITTGIADKRIPYFVAETYFDELLSCGVEIYRYTEGFFHPKMVLIDGKIATVGSCNFDVRSFRLDYEINAVLYDVDAIGVLQRQFLADKEKSVKIPTDYYRNLPFFNRLLHSVFRIGSPLM